MAAAKQAHVFQRMVARWSLRPGQMFLYAFDLTPEQPVGHVMVVLDDKREVDFWTGQEMAIGAGWGDLRVEVL